MREPVRYRRGGVKRQADAGDGFAMAPTSYRSWAVWIKLGTDVAKTWVNLHRCAKADIAVC
ncbi:hypothetical protein OKW45_005915 [Paraburkholderia sp. WSM4175]